MPMKHGMTLSEKLLEFKVSEWDRKCMVIVPNKVNKKTS